ncbi:hypothetical protein AGLY_013232 [Aphis glycines]|uniref:Uncharacterized protein n=1 Tax=Aphis glycines TaxID=307491 RepID=A0A6G0T5R0_APHGL|nr:hypothetical protein AGLY_013232 [Aphis glycines]
MSQVIVVTPRQNVYFVSKYLMNSLSKNRTLSKKTKSLSNMTFRNYESAIKSLHSSVIVTEEVCMQEELGVKSNSLAAVRVTTKEACVPEELEIDSDRLIVGKEKPKRRSLRYLVAVYSKLIVGYARGRRYVGGNAGHRRQRLPRHIASSPGTKSRYTHNKIYLQSEQNTARNTTLIHHESCSLRVLYKQRLRKMLQHLREEKIWASIKHISLITLISYWCVRNIFLKKRGSIKTKDNHTSRTHNPVIILVQLVFLTDNEMHGIS